MFSRPIHAFQSIFITKFIASSIASSKLIDLSVIPFFFCAYTKPFWDLVLSSNLPRTIKLKFSIQLGLTADQPYWLFSIVPTSSSKLPPQRCNLQFTIWDSIWRQRSIPMSTLYLVPYNLQANIIVFFCPIIMCWERCIPLFSPKNQSPFLLF